MQKRLCGREQEFGLAIFSKSGRKVSEETRHEAIETLIGIISKDRTNFASNSDDLWLVNGSRIYNDNGLLEISTAECVPGELDLIAQEKASELILNKALKRLRSLPRFKELRVVLYRNNVGYGFSQEAGPAPHPGHGFTDYEAYVYGRSPNSFTGGEPPPEMPSPSVLQPQLDDRNIKKDRKTRKEKKKLILDQEVTYGCHQNYSYRSNKLAEIFRVLKNFLPVSLPLTGNGHILRLEDGRCVYGFSQRARYIISMEGGGTTVSRSLLQVKNDDILTGRCGLGRLHLICRDATRCEFQTYLVDGITHLALRLGEEGWKMPKKLALANPIETLHELNIRTGLDYQVLTRSGKINILDYNNIFLEAAKKLHSLSPQEKKIIQEWSRVLKILQSGKWQKLIGELDWATKWFVLKSRMKKHGFKLDSIRAWRISQGYHNISDSPEESWFARLDRKGKIRHLINSKEARWAVKNAPATRAQSRGLLIKTCRKRKALAAVISTIGWEAVEFNNEQQINFSSPSNPFLVNDKTLKELEKKLEKILNDLKKGDWKPSKKVNFSSFG